MERELRPVIRVRLYGEDKCFGPGIAELLRRVQALNSLRAAAASMDMAYSKAWKTVRSCEAALGYKLLTSAVGGKNGGGACLTPEGAVLLEHYIAYADAVQAEAQRLFPQFFPE